MTIFRYIPESDLDLDDDERLHLITGVEYVRQKIASRLRFFLGEWFLDQRQGIPYFQNILIRDPNLDVIKAIYRKVFRSITEIKTTNNLELAFDPAARTLAVSVELQLVDGSTLLISKADPIFIINVDNIEA